MTNTENVPADRPTVTIIDWDGQLVTFTPNVEAFQSALDWITYHPEVWDQENWLTTLPGEVAASESPAPECGTAGCFAGTVSLMHGGIPNMTDQSVVVDGVRMFVSVHATDVLGVPGDLIDGMFSASNYLFDLWRYGQKFTGGELLQPSDDVIEAAQEVSSHLYGTPEDDDGIAVCDCGMC